MLPPFVAAPIPSGRPAAPEATLLPPLRLNGARAPSPAAGETPEPPEAVDHPVAELPWLVEPVLPQGQIDEYAAPEDLSGDVGYFGSAFRDVDLSDEWETDQLAALAEEEKEGTEASPGPPAAAAEPQPTFEASAPEAGESPPAREEPPADAFESDAEMFVKLLDELEASARAESARLDSEQGVQPGAPPASPEPAGTPDARRVEEIASRLERIARSLRERGPAGPLADEGVDPLGAMVAGYLLGLSERTVDEEPRDDSDRR